ncbi:hypothetical protein SODALDRAFT_160999 [Sodiomyces alkalinus F11]|uniref:Uncharacterized protein n=1 Tax=Sodiomyces alkalinus (strain CBS 110278 / VKM F-3762 / F11) TaxID=1314773 RepID=A0A3N2PV77_SODAK|nr:hypothetical protein SODALDRAFT_160999 [Sodiomyces alkalinus F11]ROT38374.1 hypothetical protein SODALDRAFT_160999 [Sodiomyces alkalinus F11]
MPDIYPITCGKEKETRGRVLSWTSYSAWDLGRDLGPLSTSPTHTHIICESSWAENRRIFARNRCSCPNGTERFLTASAFLSGERCGFLPAIRPALLPADAAAPSSRTHSPPGSCTTRNPGQRVLGMQASERYPQSLFPLLPGGLASSPFSEQQ